MDRRGMHLGFWLESQKKGRHTLGCVGNIKRNLKEIGWGVMDLIDLAQDRNHLGALCEH
jgi:hypothetical protein